MASDCYRSSRDNNAEKLECVSTNNTSSLDCFVGSVDEVLSAIVTVWHDVDE